MNDYSNNLLELDLVLVPGFEPGATDRESVMMDRTTLHERGGRATPILYLKTMDGASILLFIFTFVFTFTFS